MTKGPKATRASRRRRKEKEIETVFQENPCLNPTCKRGKVQRGLCKSCLSTAYRQIARGLYTWEDLEAVGLSIKPMAKRPMLRYRVTKRATR